MSSEKPGVKFSGFVPAGVCTVCRTEPCRCSTDHTGDEAIPRRRRSKFYKKPWKEITAWCPVCHFHAKTTFHEAATAAGARPHFQKLHLADRPSCGAELRFEMPKD